jgi:hypothetical protein
MQENSLKILLAIHLELRERTRRNSDDTTDEITAADDGG